jgi:hypothetical protein
MSEFKFVQIERTRYYCEDDQVTHGPIMAKD